MERAWTAEPSRLVTAASLVNADAEEGEHDLANLSFNRKQVVSLFFVTDSRKFWIFPVATYGAQEIGEWPEDSDAPASVTITFKDDLETTYRLTLVANDPRKFGVVLAKFAAGTIGLLRPKTDSIRSITVERVEEE